MTKPTFNVQLSGASVSPETVPAGELAELLQQLEKAILRTAEAEGAELPQEAVVSLVDVQEGSSRLTLAVAPAVLPAVGRLSHAVGVDDYEVVPFPAHEALYRLSEQATRRNWALEFVGEPNLHIDPAVICEAHQVPPPSPPARATGTTSICGRCVRVGGAVKPRAEIRLEGGGLLYIDVSEALAKELARSLYEVVCIEGNATWRTDDWSVEEFEGTRVAEFRATDVVAAFESLAAAAGGAWDGVDVDDYVMRNRHGED